MTNKPVTPPRALTHCTVCGKQLPADSIPVIVTARHLVRHHHVCDEQCLECGKQTIEIEREGKSPEEAAAFPNFAPND